jgi:hypothetical protein
LALEKQRPQNQQNPTLNNNGSSSNFAYMKFN